MADIRINSLPSTATSFNTDDYIPIDGASGGTRKMLAATLPLTDVKFGGTSGPSAKSSIAARAARQGLVFDGTAGATVSIASLGTAFTIHLVARPNVAGANLGIFRGSGGSIAGNSYFLSDGRAAIYNGSFYIASTSTITANKTDTWTYVLSGGTGTWYKNGVVDSTTSDAGTYPNALDRFGVEANGFVYQGAMSGLIYNRALSAAEVVSLYEAGVPSGGDYPTQVAGTALITGDSSTFTGGVGSWTGWSGGTVTAGSGAGTFTAPGGANTAAYLNVAGNLKYGFKYRIKLDISTLTGGNLLISDTTSGATWATFTATGSNQTAEFTINQTTNGYIGIRFSANAASAVIDNITLVPVGLLLAPDAAQAGGGLTWYDTSGNAANITLPASGVTWNVPSSGTLASSLTNGNVTLVPNGSGIVSQLGAGVVTYRALQTGGSTNAALFSWNNNSGLVEINSEGTTNWPIVFKTRGTEIGRLTGGGTLLLKSDGIDSANGKLQLATHTTSAGGIGFGTDTALYRAAAQSLNLDGASSPQFSLSVSGTQKARFESYSDDLYISTLTAGKSIILRSGNAATAITLDSSQRTILSGALRLNNAYTASVVVPTGYVTIQDSTGTTYKVCVLL